MKKSNIALIGFMGSGKTSISNKLSKILKRDVLSTDALIEKKEGRPIKEIFKDKGEQYFRTVEREAVQEVSRKQNVIIDCGGGVVLNPQNIEDLKANSILVFLSATAESIYEQVKGREQRPLLNVSDPLAKIKELLKERKSLYEKADITIDTKNKTLKKVCDEIIERVKND